VAPFLNLNAASDPCRGVAPSLSAISDAVSYLEIYHCAVLLNHHTSSRISQGCIFTELCFNLSNGLYRSSNFHNLPHLTQMGRVIGNFLQHALLMNVSGFRTGTDQ